MSVKYVSVPHGDMGSGIDQLSAEDSVQEGYSELLVNFDPIPEGYLAKRPGYQGVYGFLPVRVKQATYVTGSTNNLTLLLDQAIDLTRIPSPTHSRPIVVYGRTSALNTNAGGSQGDFPPGADSARYYAQFNADPRQTLSTGTHTLALTQAQFGLTTYQSMVGLAQSNSATGLDWSSSDADSVAINTSTLETDVGYTNSSGASQQAFVYSLALPTKAGVNYVTSPTSVGTGAQTVTVSAATHNLSGNNLQVRLFQVAGAPAVWTAIDVDSVVVDTSNNVTATFQNNSGGTTSVVVLITAAPLANALHGTVGPQTTQTLLIPAPSSPFAFVDCYLEQTLGGNRERVIPQDVSYVSSSNELQVTFTNSGLTSANFYVYWQYARVAGNQLTVTAANTVAAGFTDTSPQMTIWGLDHSQIYTATAGSHAGWVTELDTYRATGEQFLVAGLGGNLFSGADASASDASTYLIPTLYPNANSRVGTTASIGPCFLNSLDATYRTAGHIIADNIGTTTRASSITYDSGTDTVVVQIPLVNGTSTGGSPIVTTAGLADRLTIQDAGYAIQNGTFPITAYTLTPTLLTIHVSNANITDTAWDDPSSGALVGILTDRLTLNANSPFLPGDILLSEVLTEAQQVECLGASSTTQVLGGLNARLDFPAGVRVCARRTSQVIPLRDISDNPSVTDLVTGDNLSLTGLARQLRVLSVNVLSDTGVTISSAAGVATATLGAGNTNSLAVGDTVNLLRAGDWAGLQVITSVPTSTTFTFASSVAGSGSGTLQGCTATVDESLTWNDDVNSAVSLTVPGRWLPLEAPDTTATETPGPYVSYFSTSDYTDQPIVRSAMVNDSLILNNGTDRTLKLDGANVYRPGLPRWQPHLFLAVASGASGTITVPDISCTTVAANATIGGTTPGAWVQNQPQFFVDPKDVDTFQVGARIQVSGGSGTTYTITSAATQTLGAGASQQDIGVITVDQGIAEAAPTGTDTGTLLQVAKRSYYFRLNAVDANRNVVASAAVGSEDWSVTLATSSAVRIRLVGLPAWDIYDYDRLEVQVYSTKLTGVAPYYLLSTVPMSFKAGGGYIDFVDTFSDDTLSNLDSVNTALKGQELGTGWSHPIRAKRVTSSSNRLVLANLSSDPFIDVTLSNPGATITTSSFASLRWLLRKDETDTATTTDMVNRVGYQWLTSGDVAVTGISVSTGTFTVTSTLGASLNPGNWVYLFRKAAPGTDQQTHFMGWWQVASATSTTITFNWPGATGLAVTLSKEIDRAVAASAPADVPVWLGTDYNYQTTSATLGQNGTSPAEGMTAIRMANAVNTTQRVVDRTLTGMSAFQPWICCDAGGEFNSGEFIFRQVQNSATTFQLTLPASYSGFNVYLDNVLFTEGSSFGAVVQRFPSRILVSYPNFAEVFDSPLAQVDSQSDSAIDVNPSDGQEITAVLPFYGDSSFGAAMKDAVILVFKTNSIYLVNIAQKAAGANAVQRLESMGLGCTAPYSVTPTRNGIMFANESGIYKLQQDMTIYYMGRHLQRLWRLGTNLSSSGLSLMFGTNYAFNSQFKLSVPLAGSATPNAAYVYNSTREYSMQGITNTVQLYATREGSWTQHEGFSSIGWCNLDADNFYAALNGRVMQVRRTNLPQDYRDDDQAITATATLRSTDFGDDGVRKTVPFALVSYRNPPDLGVRTGTQVASATDLLTEFVPADATTLPNNAATSGMGDTVQQEGVTYRYSFGQKRGVRFQLQISNSTKDEPVEITKVRYFVGGLSVKGIREAAAGPTPAQA